MTDFAPLPIADDTTAILDLWFGDHQVGQFKMRFVDRYAPPYQLLLARVRRRLSRADQQRVDSPKTEEDVRLAHRLEVDVFVDSGAVVSWTMLGKDGTPVPFSEAALREFLNHPSYLWALPQLRAFSFDPENFTSGSRDKIAGE